MFDQGLTLNYDPKVGWPHYPFACDHLCYVLVVFAPLEIVDKVPPDYSGELKLDPCSSQSSAEASVDSKGTAETSACPKPGETVTLTVVRGGQTFRVPPDQVTIERAGDGFPVAIKTRVPTRE